MADDGYSLPQDSVPDFRSVPKPKRDADYSEPDVWKPLRPRTKKHSEDDDDYDDYDDADLCIQQRGKEFLDTAQKLAAKDTQRKKSGYVDVNIDDIKIRRENKSLADQMKALSTSEPKVDDPNLYADLSSTVEVRNKLPPPRMEMPAKPLPRANRPRLPQPQPGAPSPVQPRKLQQQPINLDKQVAPQASQAIPEPPVRKSRSTGQMYKFTAPQFMHGKITKDQADIILNPRPAGSFLVRISSRKRQEGPNYVLSCHACHTRDLASFDLAHFPISATRGSKGWKYAIPAADPTIGFYSLEELISFFATSHPKLSLKYPIPPL